MNWFYMIAILLWIACIVEIIYQFKLSKLLKQKNKSSNKPIDEPEMMDFPDAYVADDFRLLGYTDDDDIIIEFGTFGGSTLLASVRMSRELALALSSSIIRNIK